MKGTRLNTRKKLVAVVVALACLAMTTGCLGDSQEDRDRNTQEQALNEMRKNTPLPSFKTSRELDEAIQLYIMRNKSIDTTTLVMTYGKLLFTCPSKGYGLPYGVNVSNPVQKDGSGGNISQAEPNGLFTDGVQTQATWVICVRKNGDQVAIYSEDHVDVFPFAVKVSETPMVADIDDLPSGAKIEVKDGK